MNDLDQLGFPSVGSRLTLSIDEFCRMAGLGRTHTWGLIKEEKLTVVRLGRRTLISYASAIKLLAPELHDAYLASLPGAAPSPQHPSTPKGAQ